MARIYAGALGLLAFATVVARGIVHASVSSDTIWRASTMLFAFAAIGYLLGRTAQWIVDDSVRGRLTSQISNKPANEPAK